MTDATGEKPTPFERSGDEERMRQATIVRMALIERKMTQRQLAAAIGMDENQLSKSLKGDRTLKHWELDRIRVVLAISAGTNEADSPEHNTDAAIQARREFAQRLLDRRESLEWTIDRVAGGLIPIHRYVRLESGEAEPFLYELDLIASRLRVSLTWLITGIGVEGDPPPS